MNVWTQKRIKLANQSNYLDNKDGKKLLRMLLEQEIFPIKDGHVAYLKRDKTAIKKSKYG